MTTLIISTRNAHKLGEIQTMLGSAFHCRGAGEFPGAPDVLEDRPDFSGNALKKALELREWLERAGAVRSSARTYVLADDSGLEVDALGGAPGVHSARFAALDGDAGGTANSPDAANSAKLLRLLETIPMESRTARFRCVLALVPLEGSTPHSAAPAGSDDEPGRGHELFDGTCEGRITFQPSGSGGFGYDPLFVPEGFDRTFAELGEEVKNRISHRSKALAKLRAWFAGFQK
jgi:XTP/dITP diphosphohydrolase